MADERAHLPLTERYATSGRTRPLPVPALAGVAPLHLLAMIALAVLATSVGELRRLIIAILSGHDDTAAIRWPWWRRRHQDTARRSHYKHHDSEPATSS